MDLITGLSLAQAGMGFLQGQYAHAAQKQKYANDVAYKEAMDEYSGWAAGMQAAQTNINQDYSYWVERLNYGQQVSHAYNLRAVELSKSIAQADLVAETRTAAGANYINKASAIQARHEQEAMSEAMAMFHTKVQGLRNRASIGALGANGVGMVDALQMDVQRQVGNKATISQINQKFRDGQYTRDQAGAVAGYLKDFNSQKFYEMQEIMDPLPSFPPIPALVGAVPPSMVGSAPSSSAAFLSSVAGGFNAGLNTYVGLKGVENG